MVVPHCFQAIAFMDLVVVSHRQPFGASLGWVGGPFAGYSVQMLRPTDLCAAIISAGEGTVLLPLENWLLPGAPQEDAALYFHSTEAPDMWANYAVFLAARACHLLWQCANEIESTTHDGQESDFVQSWYRLWMEIQSWRRDRPLEMKELEFEEEINGSHTGPFPYVLYAASCAISSNQLFHTACIILLDIRPQSIKLQQLGRAGSNLWHARRICGISSTNEHHGCLNNAIQPLWVAGKLLSHPVEHKALVDLVKTIEVKTGWGTQWRISDLKQAWGYDRNEIL